MTLSRSISQYEYTRVLVLGAEVGLVIQEPRLGSGQDGFDAFVSSAYVALRETIVDDASFFASVNVLSSHSVTRTVYLLRTARQHDDNDPAVAFYNEWVGGESVDWDGAIQRLQGEVLDYFAELIRAANEVRRSRALTQRWLDSDSVSVPTVFAAVCRDLGLSFHAGSRIAKIRSVEARYRRDRPPGPKRPVVSDLCVQAALSETGVLPVPYSELLDEMGVLASRDAPAVLALAYATARALPHLAGEDFKRKTSEMWWSLVRP